jgi:hypothetical protein
MRHIIATEIADPDRPQIEQFRGRNDPKPVGFDADDGKRTNRAEHDDAR